MKYGFAFKSLSLLLLFEVAAAGATYYTSPDGNDSNPGSEARPWRTIQKGANQVKDGDTLIVRAGQYNERVATVRAGKANARIVFQAEGVVVMKGWQVSHPFISVRGFEITGHSAADNFSAHVAVTRDGDSFELLNCTVRDGIHLVKPDFVFQDNSPASGTIYSPSGGFLAAGFAPGQTIYIARADRAVALTNAGLRTIASVTDQILTTATPLLNDGPSPAYISGSFVYGLYIQSGAEQCVVKSNVFRNLSFDTWFVGGRSNLFERNIIQDTHGWDAIHFMGTNLVFRYNLIGPSPLRVHQVSPDAFENWAPSRYFDVLFEWNFVYGFKGVISSQKGTAGAMDKLTFRNNVFMDVGLFAGKNPNTTFENNTFVYVGATNTPVTSTASHALKFDIIDATNTRIQNNIFVGCGQGRDLSVLGWYEFADRPPSAMVSDNFVAGPSPGFAAKVGFDEGNAILNGGDPGFVNLRDPLGPDGVPFTSDDGLRLLPTSGLINAGAGGVTIGAYQAPVSLSPEIAIIARTNGTLTLAWPETDQPWILEVAPSATGPWSEVVPQPKAQDGVFRMVVEATGGAGFYRLVR